MKEIKTNTKVNGDTLSMHIKPFEKIKVNDVTKRISHVHYPSPSCINLTPIIYFTDNTSVKYKKDKPMQVWGIIVGEWIKGEQHEKQ